MDNVFVERLWRSLKYEEIYLYQHADVDSLLTGLERYVRYYNERRPHQGLQGATPAEVYGIQ